MYLTGAAKARSLAEAVVRSLETYGTAPTPDNYALWYEYHAGHNQSLRRTIDVIIGNNAPFDEKTLHDLYNLFFSPVKEEQAIRETSRRVHETLRDVIGLAEHARADASQFGIALTGLASGDFGKTIDDLRGLIEHLVSETRQMAGRSEFVSIRMRESAARIEVLEHNLQGALREATTDALTGVANRKSFDTMIRKLAGDAMNSGDDLALLMVDIDHFKNVNDRWGHPIGDAVIRHVAKTLQLSVRGHDHVARYGGEEFAVLLPASDTSSAMAVGENIRRALAKEPLQMDLKPPLNPITVSIGAACYEAGDPLAEWVGRTDAALYRAKKEGRNCVQTA